MRRRKEGGSAEYGTVLPQSYGFQHSTGMEGEQGQRGWLLVPVRSPKEHTGRAGGRGEGRPCRHRWWQTGHRLGRWRCRGPGSSQATPGEAESSSPQEFLKPSHTLHTPDVLGRMAEEEKRKG